MLVLGDHHRVFADSLSAALGQAGYPVSVAASTREALVTAVHGVRPQLCLTENEFRDGPVLDVLADMLRASPGTRVILLTSDDDPAIVQRALSAGVLGFVHKSRGISTVIEVLRRVAAGETVVESAAGPPPRPGGDGSDQLRSLADYLTQRELECLTLLAKGMDTALMAKRLGVSRTTVRTHVQSVLTKLGVHSRLEAASLAIRSGIVDANTPGAARASSRRTERTQP